jgi:hypothetical protein
MQNVEAIKHTLFGHKTELRKKFKVKKKAGPWIDALVVEVSTRLFLQPKEEPRLQLTNIVTTNQNKSYKKLSAVQSVFWQRLHRNLRVFKKKRCSCM